ncbi:uncharacterized protein LOC143547778 [Bidens hawaiensis]|uniref:uncharacterized protein LOC143547778 n=1 Tax=Bidens hawaiensis TaxID=980011 RepID=UPI00404AB9B7
MASSSSPRHDASQPLPISDGHSPLSSVIYELSQQVQAGMENMLKMVSEIDQSLSGVTEDIEKCNESALERKRTLEEEKELFQKAAYSVLDMLNNRRE